MLCVKRVGPTTLAAAPDNAVWRVGPIGTWRAAWARFFNPAIGQGVSGHAWLTLGLPGTSVYGRGEPWRNTFQLQEPAMVDSGERSAYAARGEPIMTSQSMGLSVTPPARLPMLGE
jgi:hypothetical protein